MILGYAKAYIPGCESGKAGFWAKRKLKRTLDKICKEKARL